MIDIEKITNEKQFNESLKKDDEIAKENIIKIEKNIYDTYLKLKKYSLSDIQSSIIMKPLDKFTIDDRKDIIQQFVDKKCDPLIIEILQNNMKNFDIRFAINYLYDTNNLNEIDYLIMSIKKGKNIIDFYNRDTIIYYLDKDKITPKNYLKFKSIAYASMLKNKKVELIITKNPLNQSNDDRVNYTFTKQELELLEEINNFLTRNNCKELLFNESVSISSYRDYCNCYGFKSIKEVDNFINKVVNIIKKNKLTPFETVLFIHLYLSNKFLVRNEKYDENVMESIALAIYTKSVNNVSMACLFKAIIDRVNNKNIKVSVNSYDQYFKESNLQIKNSYIMNTVYLKDDTYGIDGHYLEDASGLIFDQSRHNLASCLISMDIINNLKKKAFDINFKKTDRYSNLIEDDNKKYDSLNLDDFNINFYFEGISNVIDLNKYSVALFKLVNGKTLPEKILKIEYLIGISRKMNNELYKEGTIHSFMLKSEKQDANIINAINNKKYIV